MIETRVHFQLKSIRRVGVMMALATFAFAFSSLASPRLALDSPSVDFGEVAANAALVREVRVGNAGDAPLSEAEGSELIDIVSLT